MKSNLPKVLHRLNGRRLTDWVLDLVAKLNSAQTLVVVGHQAEVVRRAVGDTVETVLQEPQLGTGHAVMVALEAVRNPNLPILVLAGDTPLLRPTTVQQLLSSHVREQAAATVLVAEADNPSGCGRILLDERGALRAIVEEPDASETDKAIRLVNTSTYVFNFHPLQQALSKIAPANVQGEYYLTDAVGYLVRSGFRVATCKSPTFEETMGINSQRDLERAAQFLEFLGLGGP